MQSKPKEWDMVETTAIVRIKPDLDEVVKALWREASSLQQYAESRIIADVEDIKVATNDLSLIAKLKKAIEEKRKEYVGPINEHLKSINDAFKLFTEPLNSADSITRQKILDYRKEQERIRLEQERINELRLEAAQKEAALHSGEITESVNLIKVMPEAPKHVYTDMGTSTTMKVWRFEIIDFSLLADQYKLPDMVKIRKVITAGATIAGVRAWQEESLRVTTK